MIKRNLWPLALVFVCGAILMIGSPAGIARPAGGERPDPAPSGALSPKPALVLRSINHWIKSYGSFFAELGGTEYDNYRSVCATGDGGYVVAGEIEHHNLPPDSGGYIAQGLVMEIRPSGTIDWQVILDSNLGEKGFIGFSRVIRMKDGNYVALGSAGIQPNLEQIALAKIGPSGGVLWVRIWKDAIGSLADLVETTDGGILVASWDLTRDGLALLRLDRSGKALWGRSLAGSGDLIGTFAPRDIQPTADGGFLIVGEPFSDFPIAAVLKLDSAGGLQWNRYVYDHGVHSNSEAASVVCEPDGSAVVAGMIGHSGGHGYQYLWVFKLGPTGRVLWQKAYDRGDAQRIIKTRDGGYLLVCGGNILKISSWGNPQWERRCENLYEADLVETSSGGYLLTGDYGWMFSLSSNGLLGTPCPQISSLTPTAAMSTSAKMRGGTFRVRNLNPSMGTLNYILSPKSCTIITVCVESPLPQ